MVLEYIAAAAMQRPESQEQRLPWPASCWLKLQSMTVASTAATSDPESWTLDPAHHLKSFKLQCCYLNWIKETEFSARVLPLRKLERRFSVLEGKQRQGMH